MAKPQTARKGLNLMSSPKATLVIMFFLLAFSLIWISAAGAEYYGLLSDEKDITKDKVYSFNQTYIDVDNLYYPFGYSKTALKVTGYSCFTKAGDTFYAISFDMDQWQEYGLEAAFADKTAGYIYKPDKPIRFYVRGEDLGAASAEPLIAYYNDYCGGSINGGNYTDVFYEKVLKISKNGLLEDAILNTLVGVMMFVLSFFYILRHFKDKKAE